MGFIAFMLAGILGFASAAQPPPAAPFVSVEPGMEVFPLDFPDPMVIRSAGGYYAYGTQAPWERAGVFPILHSADLHRWTYVADALPGRPDWAVGDMWAPDVVERSGTFYLYYSAAPDLDYGDHCLGVATSNSPDGPFSDRGPIACGDGAGHGYIDPAVVLEGSAGYLYFSVDVPVHSISVIPLTDDLLAAAGPRIDLFGVSQSWEQGAAYTTVEGPFVIRDRGLYYLFYSGNDWQHDYAMGYATSTSPTGPFVKSAGNPVVSGGPDQGPGGGSLFQAGGRWMLAYHAWTGAGRTLHLASLCIDGGAVRMHC